jgi:ankyrin repeat protein
MGARHARTVKLLIDNGADVNTKKKFGGDTALKLATEYGNIEIVTMLIGAGANINAQDSYKETVIITASKWGHITIVKLLIEEGADVNDQDKNGHTALYWATIRGDAEIVKMLIGAEADLNIQYSGVIYLDSDEEFTSNSKLVKYTIEFHQYTVLIIASEMGYTEIVKLLINAGADVHLQDDLGRTASMIATEEGHNEIIQFLNEAIDKE